MELDGMILDHLGMSKPRTPKRRSAILRRKRFYEEVSLEKRPPTIALIAGLAKRNGVECTPCIRGVETCTLHVAPNDLWLGGKRCVIYRPCYVHRTGARDAQQYYSAQITRLRVALAVFVVFVVGPNERILIVPSEILRHVAWKRQRFTIYIPASGKPAGRKNSLPMVDWWQYEDAWHLLKE